MKTILLLLLISAELTAQEKFDYLMYGKSLKYVIEQYNSIGHQLKKIAVNGDTTNALYTSPRTGFLAISYGFKNDSCFGISFYFDKRFTKNTRKLLDNNFPKQSRNIWIYDDNLIILRKFDGKIKYLYYVRK